MGVHMLPIRLFRKCTTSTAHFSWEAVRPILLILPPRFVARWYVCVCIYSWIYTYIYCSVLQCVAVAVRPIALMLLPNFAARWCIYVCIYTWIYIYMCMSCVAVRCSALQCVAVRCSALQCVAVRCSGGSPDSTDVAMICCALVHMCMCVYIYTLIVACRSVLQRVAA